MQDSVLLNIIQDELSEHESTMREVYTNLRSHIYTVCVIIIDALKRGNKILIFGNGGSAADAQHISAEIVGRYKIERKAFPAIALSTDTSAITAIANDYGYDDIFKRQVEALAIKGDVLLGISTSGKSKNVINAFKVGDKIGCYNIGLSGKDGGYIKNQCKICLIIPSNNTARIQEAHITIGHIIASSIDKLSVYMSTAK